MTDYRTPFSGSVQRCDGAKPFCTVCVKANRGCKYEKPITRPVYLVLQERLAVLEERFQTLSEEAALSPFAFLESRPPTGSSTDRVVPTPPHNTAAEVLVSHHSDEMAVALNKRSYHMEGGRWYDAEVLATPHRNFMYARRCTLDSIPLKLICFVTQDQYISSASPILALLLPYSDFSQATRLPQPCRPTSSCLQRGNVPHDVLFRFSRLLFGISPSRVGNSNRVRCGAASTG